MARYYKYHVRGMGVSGPPSFDQKFGIAIHAGLEALMRGASREGAIGLALISFGPTDTETQLLIRSMLTAWDMRVKPGILDDFEVVEVEKDMNVELENDIQYMFRADMILRRKSDGKLGVHDFKTTKKFWPDYQIDSYRKNIQMAANCTFAGIVLGEKIDHYYIHFLVKGERKATWDDLAKAYSGPEASTSKLIYCYHREADPPITREDWSADFMVQSGARRRKIGDDYHRKLITDAGLTPGEWVDKLDDKTILGLFPVVGPYEAPDLATAQKYIRMVVGEELRWKSRIESVLKSPAQLDYIIPRSFDCYKYGKDNPCEFLGTCFPDGQPTIDSMTPRKPHHNAEETE